CLKMVSTNSAQGYPRILISDPDNANHTSGTVGFAWYNYLPAGQIIPDRYATFIPIAAIVSSAGVPHFFIGVNYLNQIECRRYVATSLAWNNGASANNAYPQLASTNYELLGNASSSLTTTNAWNFIEVQYEISNTGSGRIRLKINRSAGDNTLDIDFTGANTTQATNNVLSIMLGMIRGTSSTAESNGGTNSTIYTQYYDDLYWCNASGAAFNTFVGPVSCTKHTYNTVESNSFYYSTDNATALANINETFAGTGSLSTVGNRNYTNAAGQTLNLRVSSVSGSSPLNVRQYVYGYRLASGSDIAVGAVDGANSVANSGILMTTTDANTGAVKFRDYDNHPSGVEWTNANIASTTFRHEGISPASFLPMAVVLTTGSNYTVPNGATSMKVWAIGGGGAYSDYCDSGGGNNGGNGAIAVRTYSVTGGQTVSYSIGAGDGYGCDKYGYAGSTTVTYGGVSVVGGGGRTWHIGPPTNGTCTNAQTCGVAGNDVSGINAAAFLAYIRPAPVVLTYGINGYSGTQGAVVLYFE
ncbi:MAG: hypothetical protein EBQ92_04070, partial [Proteobacteria bacterium]|nr:hypothetical protein [Pseudomonadota bacterium]